MRLIFQCEQNLINEAFALLAMFFAFAASALVLLKPRFNKWIVLASTIIIWELCTLDMRLLGDTTVLKSVEFFFLIPWIFLCFRDSALYRLICSALFMFTWFITEVLTGVVFGRLLGYERCFEQPYVCIVFIVAAYLFVALITALWKKIAGQKLSPDSFANTVTLITIILAEVIIIGVNCVMIFGTDNKSINNAGFNIILSLILGFLFLDVMAFIYTRNAARVQKLNYENEILSIGNKAQADYYTKVQDSIDKTVKIRHDINNLLNVIQMLINSKTDEDYNKASTMLSDLKQTVDASEIPAICNNRLVNLILYDKLSVCEKSGVSIVDNIILSDNCGIDDIDLCRVFVNLIDNGVNALENCKPADRKLYLSCRESDGVLYIKTVNAYDKTAQKQDREGHGYGLKILNDICKRYEGDITTEHNGEKFTVLIALNTLK